ncbi:MAG: hypothetical protein GTN38_02765 [Candidatus Aenigmarchaeota archaeon]|nr:hypothetical protein [Candidatus Aenigmarchaeota archaeon]NIP40559.1 hypothetical protein [Candidatus Aenigmarchaeota archaeon]NIQ18404.1 hypothetical protein [Candidatus Aenigmarchaeota archaeon]
MGTARIVSPVFEVRDDFKYVYYGNIYIFCANECEYGGFCGEPRKGYRRIKNPSGIVYALEYSLDREMYVNRRTKRLDKKLKEEIEKAVEREIGKFIHGTLGSEIECPSGFGILKITENFAYGGKHDFGDLFKKHDKVHIMRCDIKLKREEAISSATS